ncbi:MAG: tRNA (guanosine(46)-N7)-methyltransferase TrmB [Nitrospina sp.]|nr:tRNA (guanosine(46)-N7)-methyltransferase TrmB [Nitrospina sp.]
MSLMTARPSSDSFSIQDPNLINIETHPDWGSIFGNRKPIKLEIGFGMGDFLIEMAIKETHNNFIGIDFTKNGTLSLLARINSLKLNNIRVIYGDAKKKLPTIFQDKELEAIYINFPDPWPRKRHIKLRLINPTFVNLIMQKLAIEGRVYLATDSELYAQEILEYFNTESLCQNMNQKFGFLENRDNLPKTKYEKSFIYAGEKTYYLEYSRSRIIAPTEKHKTPAKNKKINISLDNLEKPESNDAALTEKFQRAEVNAKDACDLKKIGDSIAKAGDQEWAKNIYQKVEEEAKDSLDFNWLAYSIYEVLGDNNWARKVYKKSENQAASSLDFNWLGYSVSETIKDYKWVEILYEKATNEPCNIRELCDLADSISGTFRDVDWVKKVYRLAEEKTEEYSDCCELADAIYKNLNDKQKTRALYNKAEGIAKEVSDLCSLAESVYKKFNDSEWAKNLYYKAESKAKDSLDLCNLADSICENLGDKIWARKLYHKAANEAELSYEFRWLGDSIYKKLCEVTWAKKIYKKAEEKANFFYEFRRLAEHLCKNLGEKEWAEGVYKKAQSKAIYTSDLDYLNKSALKNLGEQP